MPQIFRIGSYWVYFWSNENKPIEPIHVHVAEGKPVENATKVWITQSKKCLLCNNNCDIPNAKLKVILRVLEANAEDIISKWKEHFGEVRYFC